MTIKDTNVFNDPEENVDGVEGAEELFERFSLTVDKGQEPMRLDKFLVARIENASRNKVQQSIESGRVTVNGKTVQANHKIKPGEEIIVYSDKEMHGEEIIPEEMKGRFQNWMFGCDTCQDVCPWNRFSKPHQEKAFQPLPEILNLNSNQWEEMTEETFKKTFRNSPLSRSKYKGIRRNLKFLKA